MHQAYVEHSRRKNPHNTNGCGCTGDLRELTQFDREAARICARVNKKEVSVVELGCGCGKLALEIIKEVVFRHNKGLRLCLFDRVNNLGRNIEDVRRVGDERLNVTFQKLEARKIGISHLPETADIAIAMRTLHWMPMQEASDYLNRIASIMEPGQGLLCVSIGAMEGDLARHYRAANDVISNRYGALGFANGYNHPATLYSFSEAVRLAQDSGFQPYRTSPAKTGGLQHHLILAYRT